MAYKSELQSNNVDLQTILNTINSLPEAGASSSGLDTSDATATESDIANGITAYANGSKITGNIPISSSFQFALGAGYNATASATSAALSLTLNNPTKTIVNAGAPIQLQTGLNRFGNAAANQVLKGKTFTSTAGLKETGTLVMPKIITYVGDKKNSSHYYYSENASGTLGDATVTMNLISSSNSYTINGSSASNDKLIETGLNFPSFIATNASGYKYFCNLYGIKGDEGWVLHYYGYDVNNVTRFSGICYEGQFTILSGASYRDFGNYSYTISDNKTIENGFIPLFLFQKLMGTISSVSFMSDEVNYNDIPGLPDIMVTSLT